MEFVTRNHFISSFLAGNEFKRRGKELILVIPPKRGEPQHVFGPKQFDELYDEVTAFSLMTYDYSNPQRPGTYCF